MAVKKTGTSFVCYLLDFGNMVTISQTNMRPLPSEFLTKPPCAFQVKEISGKWSEIIMVLKLQGLFGWFWAQEWIVLLR